MAGLEAGKRRVIADKEAPAVAQHQRGATSDDPLSIQDDGVRGCIVLHLFTGAEVVDSSPFGFFRVPELQVAHHVGKGAVGNGKSVLLQKDLPDSDHIAPAPFKDPGDQGEGLLPSRWPWGLLFVLASQDLSDGVPRDLESETDLADAHSLAVKGLGGISQVLSNHGSSVFPCRGNKASG